MQLPEVRNARQVYAMRSEMLRIARAADRHDVRIMVRAAFYTGMRLGEILRVQVRDGLLVLEDTKNGDLRHSAASERVNAEVPMHTVGEVLGHCDARSTKRKSHHRQDTLAEAVATIGKKRQAA